MLTPKFKMPIPKPAPVGRPVKITPAIIDQLEEAFALGASDVEACFFAGISKSTLYDYQQKHPEFTDRKEALKEMPVLLARQTIVKAMKYDPELALKYVERKVKKEFSLRSELTGADGEALVPTTLTEAEQKKLLGLLKKKKL